MPKFRMSPLQANNILELYQQRHRINLDPPYQRLSVWDDEKKARFIDSIINEMDTPKIYFHDVRGRSNTDEPFRFSVIDGKQRILALFEFIENRLRLPGISSISTMSPTALGDLLMINCLIGILYCEITSKIIMFPSSLSRQTRTNG